MRVLLTCALVAYVTLVPVVGAAAATESCRAPKQPDSVPSLTLGVRLAAAATLPVLAKRSLMREVEAIWCREGITVRWLAAGDVDLAGGRSARVVVVSWPVAAAARDGHTWPIGELRATDSGSSLALVSMWAARRAIEASGTPEEPGTRADHRLGVVLGRAVSHELGHQLLGNLHARQGLMRAQIPVTEFADLRWGGFELDRTSAARIRRLLADTPALSTRVQTPLH